MKVSLSWLKTHLDLADTSVEKMRDLLTFAGVEVEDIEHHGIDSDKIIVAQILESVPHPKADRLSVCQVDDGSGTPRQIVCGAKNYKVGDKVPLALPGAVLPGGLEIKEGKLRDVVSNGMMCSGRELGLSQDHAGLLILDASAPVGRPFREVSPPDVIFDLEITPNRPDLLSHRGLARELAALTGKSLLPGETIEQPPSKEAKPQEVKLEAADACPFYSVRMIHGVKVSASPEWLQQRLQSVGLRPINNIVDITNFVLLETGQPLHAFDADKLSGGIVVRKAAADEFIAALDGGYSLAAEDLVIADSLHTQAIAGVMGGAFSGVTDSTQNILLEAAWFTPSGVRRTARRLSMNTDSSYRFERGVDAQQVLAASALATKLVAQLAGGKAEAEVLTVGEVPQLTGEVEFDETRALKLIGIPSLQRKEMHHVLSSLGLQMTGERMPSMFLEYFDDLNKLVDHREKRFSEEQPTRESPQFWDWVKLFVESDSNENEPALKGAVERLRKLVARVESGQGGLFSTWNIPSYRMDLQRSVDLTEEVARVVGLDRVPSRTSGAFTPSQGSDRTYDFTMNLRHALVQRGWFEVQTLRLISQSQLRDVLGPPVSMEKAIALKNPLSEDHTLMRPSLVPGLVCAAELNIRQGQSRLRFFEIGRVFITNPNGTSREEDRIALLLSGPVQAASWHEKDPSPVDVYDLRGVLEAIVGGELEVSAKRLDHWLLSAEIKRGSKALGWLAQVAPSRARELDARHPLYAAELSLSALMQGSQSVVKFTELPRFPSITRDVALEVPADLPNGKIAAFFDAQKEPLLAGAEVFDVFADPAGQKLPKDKKSVAWSLTYRSPDRTLETAEVDAVHNRILKALVGTLPAIIR